MKLVSESAMGSYSPLSMRERSQFRATSTNSSFVSFFDPNASAGSWNYPTWTTQFDLPSETRKG